MRRLQVLADNERSRVFTGYSLSSITALLNEMGNPHRKLHAIHIAGTNGKGSTAHFIHRILCAAGFRTGLYTSPHLISVNERIRIDERLIDDADFEKIEEEVFSIIEQNPNIQPTWFDALTAIAFRYFQSAHVDYAVIESGLGGRLDSTNVITPCVSIITNVDIDHTALLGDTIEKIAGEKAGIIKRGVPVITAACGDARDVIQKRAQECNAPLFVYGDDFSSHVKGDDEYGRCLFDYEFCAKSNPQIDVHRVVNIPLLHHLPEQHLNASMAITAAVLVEKGKISNKSLRDGIGTCRVPGRLEKLLGEPLVIFDPAHNVAAMTAVCEYLQKSYPDREKVAVLHCMADKDVDGMIAIIQNMLTETIFYVIQSDERAFVPGVEYGEMMKIFVSEKELAEALRARGDCALFFFTGSFRLYSCAKRIADDLSRET